MSNARTEDIAARYVLRREEADWSGEDEAEFQAWMDRDTRNKVAFWRLQHGWSQADRIAALGVPQQASRPTSIWQRRLPMAACIVACVLISGLAFGVSENLARKTYSTVIAGRQTVPLTDGSTVELNTSTQLRAAINTHRRDVWLDRGEAYFEVAHDAQHPFVVHAGPKTITVVGTKFSVRRDGDRVEVAVVEGKVRVADTLQIAGEPSTPSLVRGGMIIARGPSTLIKSNDIEAVNNELGWREGKLIFQQSDLREVAAEFNRYNRKKLVVEDQATAAMRIGGTFEARNIDAFAELLREAYGLQVDSDGETIKIHS